MSLISSRRRMSTPAAMLSKQRRWVSQPNLEEEKTRGELEIEIKELHERMYEVNSLSEEVMHENTLLKDRISSLEDELSASQASNQSLKQQIQEKDFLLHAIEDENHRLERELVFREDDIACLQEELVARNDEQDLFFAEHEQFEKQASVRERALTFDFDDKFEQLQRKHAKLVDEMKLLKKNNRNQMKKLKELRRVNANLKTMADGVFDEVVKEIAFCVGDCQDDSKKGTRFRKNGLRTPRGYVNGKVKFFGDDEFFDESKDDYEEEASEIEETKKAMSELTKEVSRLTRESERVMKFIDQSRRSLEDSIFQAKPVNKKVLFYLLQQQCTLLGLDVPNPKSIVDEPITPVINPPLLRSLSQPLLSEENEKLELTQTMLYKHDDRRHGLDMEDILTELSSQEGFFSVPPGLDIANGGNLSPLDKKDKVITFLRRYSDSDEWKSVPNIDDNLDVSAVFTFRFHDSNEFEIDVSFLYPLCVLVGHYTGVKKPSIAYAIALTLSGPEQARWFSQLLGSVLNRLLTEDSHELWDFVFSVLTLVCARHESLATHSVSPREMNGRFGDD